MTPRARLAAVLAAGLVPWLVVLERGAGSVSLVFSFGLVNPAPLHLTTLPDYLLVLTRGLPESLLAWPVASVLWVGALASALSGPVAGREDGRFTGGLLALAGASLLPVTVAVGRPVALTALPLGTVVLWAVAWWGYGGDLARMVRGGAARER